MVLQREMAVPIWGTAKPGEAVPVKFRDQEKKTEADKDGRWSVKLDALKAGGPDKLTVSGANTVTLEDVLVGEVWVGSGQSNMQGSVAAYVKGDEVLAKLAAGAPYAKIRLLTGNAATGRKRRRPTSTASRRCCSPSARGSKRNSTCRSA